MQNLYAKHYNHNHNMVSLLSLHQIIRTMIEPMQNLK